jgi:TP901 family phage tail tape measure protein
VAGKQNIGRLSVDVVPDAKGFKEAVAKEAASIPPVPVKISISKAAYNDAIKERNKAPGSTKLKVSIEITKTAVNAAVRERNKAPGTTKLKVAVDFDRKQLQKELHEAGAGLSLSVKARSGKEAKEILAEQKEMIRLQHMLTLAQRETNSARVAELAELERVKQQGQRLTAEDRERLALLKEQIALRTIQARQEASLARQRANTKPFAARFSSNISQISRQLSDFEHETRRVLRNVTLLWGGANAVILASVTATVASALRQYALAEQQAARAAAVFASSDFVNDAKLRKQVGTSIDAFRQVGQAYQDLIIEPAKRVALETLFDTKEVAEGFKSLAQAGVPVRAAIGQIGEIAKFAQNESITLDTAVQSLVTGFQAAGFEFDKQSGKLGELADKFTFVANASTTTAEEVSQAFSRRAVQSFKAYGQSADEAVNQTLSLIDIFARIGRRGLTAGEQIGIIVRELNKAAFVKAPDVWKKYGIEIGRVNGKVVPFTRTLEQVTELFQKTTNEKGARGLAVLRKELGLTEKAGGGLIEILPQLENLLRRKGPRAFEDFANNIGLANGAVERQASLIQNTLSFQVDALINSIQNLGISFAQDAGPKITAFLKELNATGSGLSERLDPLVRSLGIRFSELAEDVIRFLSSWRGRRAFADIGKGIMDVLRATREFGSSFSKAFNKGRTSQRNFFEILASGIKMFGELNRYVLPKLGSALGSIAHFIDENRTAIKYLSLAWLGLFGGAKVVSVFLKPISLVVTAIQSMTTALLGEAAAAEAATAANAGLLSKMSAFFAAGTKARTFGIAGLSVGAVAATAYGLKKLYDHLWDVRIAARAAQINSSRLDSALKSTRETLNSMPASVERVKKALSDQRASSGKLYRSTERLMGLLAGEIGKKPDPLSYLNSINASLERQEKLVLKNKQAYEAAFASFAVLSAQTASGKFTSAVLAGQIKSAKQELDDLELLQKFATKKSIAIEETSAKQLARLSGVREKYVKNAIKNGFLGPISDGLSDTIDKMGGVRSIGERILDLEEDITEARRKQKQYTAQQLALDKQRRGLSRGLVPFGQRVALIRRDRRERENLQLGGGIPSPAAVRSLRAEERAAIRRATAAAQSAAFARFRGDNEFLSGKRLQEVNRNAIAFDAIMKRIKGSTVDTKREFKALGDGLARLGRTDSGRQLLNSFGPNMDRLIAQAGRGKRETNRLLAQIGDTRVGRRFLRDLGITLDEGGAAARTKGRQAGKNFKKGVSEGLAADMQRQAQETVNRLRALFGVGATDPGLKDRGKQASRSFASGIRAGFAESVVPFLATIPQKTKASTPALSKTLNASGEAAVRGLSDGMRGAIKPILLPTLVSITKFIKDNKGPVEYDRTILVPAGQAIMQGLVTGLQQGFGPLKSFLRDVGPSMEEYVPDSLFLKRSADFLLDFKTQSDPRKAFADLVPTSLGAFAGTLDPTLAFLHRTLSLADTTRMAQHIASLYGGTVSSVFRPGAITSSGNLSDHGFGTAADITGPASALDRIAAAMKPLFGTIFKQEIWRNHDLNRGWPIPNHMDHIHLAWLMGKGFSLNSGKIGKSFAATASPFTSLFEQAASKFGVSVNLLRAVAKAESNFNPGAGSSAGARGLMQLMPATFAAQHVGTNILDPRQNILAGAKYLKSQLSSFHDTRLALAAYNAGPGAVRMWGGVPPFGETQAYIQRVLKYLKEFGGFRAMGGPVATGSSYMVGERGPEMFMPNRPGFIMSNDRLDKMLRLLEKQVASGGSGSMRPIELHAHSNAIDPEVYGMHTAAQLRSQLAGVRL